MSVYVVTKKGKVIGIYTSVYLAFHADGDRVDKYVVNKNYKN